MRTILVLSISLLLSACAGLFVTIPDTTSQTIDGSDINPASQIMKKDILYEWRNRHIAPNISTTDNLETWTYNEGNDWCGIFFVALPLMLPVCNRYDVYTFKGDMLISHKQKTTQTHGFMCSLLWEPCDGCGICGAVH